MGETWLKIKAWTKGILALLIAVYLIFFLYNNSRDIEFWYWFGHSPHVSSVFLTLVAFLAGVICTVLAHTTWRTVRQIRDVHAGRRLDKLERENADIRTKAAMLQASTGDGVTIRVDQAGQP